MRKKKKLPGAMVPGEIPSKREIAEVSNTKKEER